MVALGRVRHDKMKDTQVLVSTLQRPHGATSSRIMSFSSSGKEAHLNTAVVAATKKRYETYKQATQLYFDVQRAKGEVYHVLFQRDGALGFSLHLVRDGDCISLSFFLRNGNLYGILLCCSKSRLCGASGCG